MKVENRKLFSNRDARSKLANMGGIMTSSPELMGEAQRFSEGSKDAVAANNGGPPPPPLTERMITEDAVARINEKDIIESNPITNTVRGLLDGDFGVEYQRDALRRIFSGEFGEKFRNRIMWRATGGDFGPEANRAAVSVLEDLGARVTRNTFNDEVDGVQVTFPQEPTLNLSRLEGISMFTGGKPTRSPFVQESVDQLGAPSTEVDPSIPLGFSSDSPIRTESPQGLSDLSIDQMMNAASTRPAPAREGIETLSTPAAEFVPRFPGDTQFQQDMVARDATPPAEEGPRTLGDVVEEDPRTANRQAALAKLKEQVSNFSLFPDAARREENLSRFLDGAIDTPSGAVTAPMSQSQSTDFPRSGPPSMGFPTALEQARLEKQFQSDVPVVSGGDARAVRGSQSATQADLVNEMALRNREMASEQSGMLSPAEELASRSMDLEAEREARILAESMALIAERDPEAIARINDGTSISSRVNNIVEPVEAQAQTFPDMSESEQLLAVAPVAAQSATQADLANEMALRNREMASEQSGMLSPAEELEMRNMRPSFAPNNVSTLSGNNFTNDPTQGYSFPKDVVVESPTQDVGNVVKAVAQRLGEGVDAPIAENLDQIRADEAAQEFRAQEEKLTQGSLNSMSIAESDKINPFIDIDAAKKVVDPLVITTEDGNGTGQDGTATGGNGTAVANSFLGTSGTPTENVAKYEARFKDMLGIKDEDKAKEMWHNMSMIGFAIAAGQDPNALANVANGMLAGTKMMKEDRATNQAREDKIKVMAYNAEREDTQSKLDYQRNVALLGIKGANAIATAGASASSRSTAADRLYEGAFDSAMAAFKTAIEDETMTAEQAADRARAIADKSFPDASQASGVVTEPEVPNPKVVALVADLKTKGSSDAKLRAQLIEKGLNPATYGV